MMAPTSVRKPTFERIEPGRNQSLVWRHDDYPWNRSVWNCHPEVEIHLITASTGTQYVGDDMREFAPGRLVMLGSWLPHDWVSAVQYTLPIPKRDVVLQFDPARFQQLDAIFPETRGILGLIDRSKRGLQFNGAEFADVRCALVEMGNLSASGRILKLLDILSALAESAGYEILSSVQYDHARSSKEREDVEIVIKYINENYCNQVSLGLAAEIISYRPDRLSRVFKRHTGKNFIEYVRTLRLRRAAHDLRATNKGISFVSGDNGYSNLSNFNRQFRKHFRQTPREYRRAQQNINGGSAS